MAHPHEERERGASFLELFFDLVFVYAITQISSLIRQDANVEAFLRATLIFSIVWWGWSQFTWTCNGIDVDDRRARVAMLLATIAAFFMAQDLPDAFTSSGEWFSLPFGITMTFGLGLYWWGLRDEAEHQRALVTYVPLAIAGTLLATASGFLDDSRQEWGYAGTLLVFVASGIASEFGTPFHVYPRHFAERHALIVIIALGESIVAVGVGSAGLERTGEFAFAVAIGAAGVAVLWWSYFDWFQEAAERALRAAAPHGRGGLARDMYTFAHFPIVLGIVGIAVAAEEMIAHPSSPLEDFGRFALAAGNVLYLLGVIAGEWRARRRLLVDRLVAAGVVVVVVAALPNLDAIVVGAGAIAIHLAALVSERLRGTAPVRSTG